MSDYVTPAPAPAIGVDALETFVELLARVEDDASSDAFYAAPVRGDVPRSAGWTAR